MVIESLDLGRLYLDMNWIVENLVAHLCNKLCILVATK